MSGTVHVGYVLKMYPRLSETFILNEILELERQGARVTVFSLRPAREGRFHRRLADVAAEVLYLPSRGPADLLSQIGAQRDGLRGSRRTLGELFWEEIERDENPSIRGLGHALDLAREAKARGVQHLHAHFATAAADAARAAGRLAGIPYSVTAHAKDIYLDAHDPAQMRRRLGDAAFLVTVCEANREPVQRLAGEATPVYRIYNGLNLEEFPLRRPPRARDVFRILAVGRLVTKKGFDVLIDSCSSLRERGLTFETRIVGDGDLGPELRAQIQGAHLSDVVKLVGPQPNEVVREEMEGADVFALPCRIAGDGNRDALPTVLLEAQALGLPFVSTPVTGIPEIAGGGDAGRLVPENSPEDLAAALAELAAQPAARESLSRAGRARAEELFDIQANVALLLARFRESAGVAPAREAVTECTPST